MFARAWGLIVAFAACGTPQPVAPAVGPAVAPAVAWAPPCRAPEPIRARTPLPFGFYSVPVDRFALLADAGVTMVGPYYGEPPDAALLDAAEAHGLGVVYPIGFETAPADDEARDALDAQLDAQLGAVVGRDVVVAWYVLPEELRPWVQSELDYLAWVRDAVRTRDPKGRPLLGYQPNHRRREELASISASFDVVTRGLYANFVGARRGRAWVRAGAETIAAATASGQAPWAVLEMFEQPEDTDAVAAWVRHDVYASLVGGARGVLVFSGFPRQGFPAYATYLDAYLDAARELNGPAGLATPLLRGVASADAGVELIRGPRTVEVDVGGRSRGLTTLGARAVQHQGDTWLYLVNSGNAPIVVELPTRCPAIVHVGPRVRGDRLELDALEVAVLQWGA